MTTTVYNCPCCGAPLTYSGESNKLECASCENTFNIEILDGLKEAKESNISFEMSKEKFENEDIKGYSCKNCSAELMTDDTTIATQCPYCGSPTVLPIQIESGVKPQYLISFKITKEQATEAFHGYFKGKKLMPNNFLNSKNPINEMRKWGLTIFP